MESQAAKCISTSWNCSKGFIMFSNNATIAKVPVNWSADIPSGEHASIKLVREPCTLAGLAGIISGLYCAQAFRSEPWSWVRGQLLCVLLPVLNAKPDNQDTTNWGLSGHSALHELRHLHVKVVEKMVEIVCSFPSFP